MGDVVMRAGVVKARCQAFAILAVGLILTAATKPAETLTGKIVKVADGDTVTLLVGTEQIRVRLWGIDAPEKGQAFGNRAKQALSDKVFGRVVRVDDLGKDKYGRLAAVEESARKARRGLWADRDPVPPWDWRRQKK